MGVNKAVKTLAKSKKCKYAVVTPAWKTKITFTYVNGKLVEDFGYKVPRSLATSQFRKWCGESPKRLLVHAYVTTTSTSNKPVVVASFVTGHDQSERNPLLAKMLLRSRGFITGAGCYKCVPLDTELGSLKPMSNALKLIRPDYWVVTGI